MDENPLYSVVNVDEELGRSYVNYAMSVIIARALPDVRDGLKPVQRRILYAMRMLNNTADSGHIKCAKVTGQTSGDYHPHGDQVIYRRYSPESSPISSVTAVRESPSEWRPTCRRTISPRSATA